MDNIDFTIIGGGVNGLAIAYVLGQQYPGKSIFVLEKNRFLGEEQSGRNSGVLHSGYGYTPRSLKAGLCPWGNKMAKALCAAENIPCATAPKYVVAKNAQEKATLSFYYQRARENGVQAELIDRVELQRREPNVSGIAALCTPETAIIDAASYIKTLERLASRQRAHILTQTKIISLQAGAHSFLITVEQQHESYTFESHIVINCAGLYADELARMVNTDFPHHIIPFRGEYMKLKCTREELKIYGSNINAVPFPIPGLYDQYGSPRMQVGVHITPTFEQTAGGSAIVGNSYLVGPLSSMILRKDDYESNRKPASEFLAQTQSLMEGITAEDLKPDYAGIQVKIKGWDDFVLQEDTKCPQLIHGIVDSPGLTCALPFAEYMVERIIRNKV